MNSKSNAQILTSGFLFQSRLPGLYLWRTFTVLFSFFVCLSVHAQSPYFECGHIHEEQDSTLALGGGGEDPCYDRDYSCGEDYIPFYKDLTSYGIVTVRLNFHFISTGENNPSFGPVDGNCPSCIGNEEMNGYAIAQEMIDRLNYRATNLWDYNYREYTDDTTFTWEPFKDANGVIVARPSDIRIRFELYDPDSVGAVHFHHLEDHKYNMNPYKFENNDCNSGQVSILEDFNYLSFPYLSTALNIILYDEYYPIEFFNDTVPCRKIRGAAGNPSPHVNFWHYWKIHNDTLNPDPPSKHLDILNSLSKLILHEVGHNLGLPHTFESIAFCDANEIGLCSNNWDCTTNVMGYNEAQGAFSPGQVDRMLNTAYRNKIPYTHIDRSSLYLCEKESGLEELNTGNKVIWNEKDTVITKDIVIKSGTKLWIENICVGFAKDVRIYVERGAEMRVENATLRTACIRVMTPDNDETVFSRKWGGIRVAGNPNIDHPSHYTDTLYANDPGRVILLPGTLIQEAAVGISDDWHLPMYDPTRWGGYVYAVNMTFENCFKAVEFMRRGSKVSKSKFHSITVDGYRYHPHAGSATIRDSSAITGKTGISVWSTQGIEIENCTFQNLDNYGVNTIDGSFIIANSNKFDNIAGVGVEALATRPAFSPTPIIITGAEHYKNRFKDNTLGIRISGYGDIFNRVEYSEFNSILSKEEKGVEITGNKILLQHNSFQTIFNGIGIHEMGDLQNHTFNNIFSDFSTGILYYNGRPQNAKFACNAFAGNRFAGVNVAHPVFPDQGDAIVSNANLWLRSTNPVPATDIKVFRSANDIGDPIRSAFDDDFSAGTSPVFTYYVRNMESAGSTHRPQCNVSVPPCLGVLYNENYLTANAQANLVCDLPFTPENPFEEETIPWHNDKIDSLETAGIDSLNIRWYYSIKASKYNKILARVHHYVGQDQISSAESVLSGETDFGYRWMAFGLKMLQEDYSAADDILDDLLTGNTNPEIEEFVYVQKENIEWSADPTYVADSTKQAHLRVIAHKPTLPGATAKALLGFWNDEVFPPHIDYPADTIVPPLKRIEEETLQSILPKDIIIYPNPGDGLFTLDFQTDPGLDNSVEIILYSLGGSPLQKIKYQTGSGNKINLDYRSHPAGVYILKIQSGDLLLHRKIIIQ